MLHISELFGSVTWTTACAMTCPWRSASTWSYFAAFPLSLNFMHMSSQEVFSCIENKDLGTLRALDQLNCERKKGNVLQGFLEGELTFPPTYKYQPDTDRWDKWSGMWLSLILVSNMLSISMKIRYACRKESADTSLVRPHSLAHFSLLCYSHNSDAPDKAARVRQVTTERVRSQARFRTVWLLLQTSGRKEGKAGAIS